MQPMPVVTSPTTDPATSDRPNTVQRFSTWRPSRVYALLRASVGHVKSELATLLSVPSGQEQRRRPIPVVGITACGLIVAAAWLQQAHPGVGRILLGEQASLWWPAAFARLPGSFFAPALRLPMWGALAQVLFCFGLAETHLGRRTTLLVALLTHAVATVSARLFLGFGPHAPFHLGLPNWVRWQRDTGPSAAVVGLGTYLGVTLRLPVLTSLLVGIMTLEMFMKPDLADREHLVAIAVGGVAAIVVRATQSIYRHSMVAVPA